MCIRSVGTALHRATEYRNSLFTIHIGQSDAECEHIFWVIRAEPYSGSQLLDGGLRLILALESKAVIIVRFRELRCSRNNLGENVKLTGKVAALTATIRKHIASFDV